MLEAGRTCSWLWESAEYFVVVGRSGRIEDEVDVEACQAAGVPVLRRSSGGGTVLQGPGCLNFSMVLSLVDRPELWNVARSYEVILGWVTDALGVPELCVCGSDILLHGKKVSGSAQRRTRDCLLHHGTVLCGMDIGMIERCLREPRRRPEHRGTRTHREFIASVEMPACEVRLRLETVKI